MGVPAVADFRAAAVSPAAAVVAAVEGGGKPDVLLEFDDARILIV